MSEIGQVVGLSPQLCVIYLSFSFLVTGNTSFFSRMEISSPGRQSKASGIAKSQLLVESDKLILISSQKLTLLAFLSKLISEVLQTTLSLSKSQIQRNSQKQKLFQCHVNVSCLTTIYMQSLVMHTVQQHVYERIPMNNWSLVKLVQKCNPKMKTLNREEGKYKMICSLLLIFPACKSKLLYILLSVIYLELM